MKVWAIFSIENEYNQPENNLEKLFKDKPTKEKLNNWYQGYVDEVAGYTKNDRLEQMLSGQEVRFTKMGADYRLEEVEVEE